MEKPKFEDHILYDESERFLSEKEWVNSLAESNGIKPSDIDVVFYEKINSKWIIKCKVKSLSAFNKAMIKNKNLWK